MKVLTLIVSLITLVLVTFYSTDITNFLVESGGSWFMSFLLPRILALICAVIMSLSIYKLLNTKPSWKIICSVLMLAAGIGGYLSVNLPYVEDFMLEGDSLNLEDNKELLEIISENENYDGVVMIASSTCPHCMAAARKLSLMQKRSPELDILVQIYSKNEEKIEDFKLDSGVSDLNYRLTSDQDATMALCQGKFPTFIYIQGGKIVKRWFNQQMGYRALDQIENRLK